MPKWSVRIEKNYHVCPWFWNSPRPRTMCLIFETRVSQYGTPAANNRRMISVELISASFPFINYVNIPMIGRSFLIFWSRRWTKGPANMSISTANEVCITIIVNTSTAILSPFIFSFLLIIILWMVYRIYWHGLNLFESRLFIYLPDCRFRRPLILWRSAGQRICESQPHPAQWPCGNAAQHQGQLKKKIRSRRKENSRNPTSRIY